MAYALAAERILKGDRRTASRPNQSRRPAAASVRQPNVEYYDAFASSTHGRRASSMRSFPFIGMRPKPRGTQTGPLSSRAGRQRQSHPGHHAQEPDGAVSDLRSGRRRHRGTQSVLESPLGLFNPVKFGARMEESTGSAAGNSRASPVRGRRNVCTPITATSPAFESSAFFPRCSINSHRETEPGDETRRTSAPSSQGGHAQALQAEPG